MFPPVEISIEKPKAVSAEAELQLLRQAVECNPAASKVRYRLAKLLHKMDTHHESVAVLRGGSEAGLLLKGQLLLVEALFACHSAETDQQAHTAAERALAMAKTASERAQCLAELAKARLRMGEKTAALDLLREAISLDPANVTVFKRLALLLIQQGHPEQALALTDELEQRQICHSRLIAARTMALAALGKPDLAQAAFGEAEFISHSLIDPPEGWEGIDPFNAALAKEIANHPDMRFERYGTSSEKTWRIDHPATGQTSAMPQLLEKIAQLASAHIESLRDSDHLWLRSAPKRAVLRSWCVITEGEGYERWHMHPEGWMSGGYYVEVPDAVVDGDDPAGCLSFGLPGGLIGETAARAFGERLVRPRPGMLTLFPSHAYHRTYPHGAQGKRICIAFDIGPLESVAPPQ